MSSLSSIQTQDYSSVEQTLRQWHRNANELEAKNWSRLTQNDKLITYDCYDLTHKMANHLLHTSKKAFVFSVIDSSSNKEAFLLGRFKKQTHPEKTPHFKIKFLVTNPKNLKLSIDLPTRVTGAGTCALRGACSFAVESGASKIYADAVNSSVGFYKRLGFVEAKKEEKSIAAKTLVLKKEPLKEFVK